MTINADETELTCDRTSIVLQANGAVSYDWQNGEMVVTAPGTYTVIGTNANGCSATASVEITQNVEGPKVTIRPSADKLRPCGQVPVQQGQISCRREQEPVLLLLGESKVERYHDLFYRESERKLR